MTNFTTQKHDEYLTSKKKKNRNYMQKITFFRCSIRFRLCASSCCFSASFLLFFFLLWNPPTKSLPVTKTPNQKLKIPILQPPNKKFKREREREFWVWFKHSTKDLSRWKWWRQLCSWEPSSLCAGLGDVRLQFLLPLQLQSSLLCWVCCLLRYILQGL